MYSDEVGELAVRFARATIISFVKNEDIIKLEFPEIFDTPTGAFVTLNTHPAGDLRGCIGYPGPYFPLKETLEKAAQGATEDPRFPKLAARELDNIVVEVSILTPPELIEVENPREYTKKVTVGRDGLILEKGPYKGLLLPQVPVEWNWDVTTFLSQTCMKAGLLPDAWLEDDTKIYRFTAEVFTEEEPEGRVVRKELHESS